MGVAGFFAVAVAGLAAVVDFVAVADVAVVDFEAGLAAWVVVEGAWAKSAVELSKKMNPRTNLA